MDGAYRFAACGCLRREEVPATTLDLKVRVAQRVGPWERLVATFSLRIDTKSVTKGAPGRL